MRLLGRRLALVLALGFALALLPSPAEAVPDRAKNAIVVFVVVAGIGKVLYDTLFFDHYRP